MQFFGVRPDQTVIGITPGSGGYGEILAPLLYGGGHYIAPVKTTAGVGEPRRDDDALHRKFAGSRAIYGNACFVAFDPHAPVLGAPEPVDVALTFGNMHTWGAADPATTMFKVFSGMLKPGGVLGVVDQRASDAMSAAVPKDSGYRHTGDVVKLPVAAGLTLQASSDIDANARDTKNYPQGVWTLPATLALGQQDKAKYLAIGEPDRMTLRFAKPAASAVAAAAL